MPTLGNINGASLVANLDPLRQDIKALQGRNRAAKTQQTLQDRINTALGIAPAPEQVQAHGLLSRLAPNIAKAAQDIFQSKDQRKAQQFRQEAVTGVALADKIQKTPGFFAKQKLLADEAAKVSSQGGDVSRLVQLSNMSEAQLNLELSKMKVIGKEMLTAIPSDTFRVLNSPDKRAAIAAIMSTNPAIAAGLLSQRDNQLARDAAAKAQRIAASNAAANARRRAAAPSTALGKTIAQVKHDVANGSISQEAGQSIIDNARTEATAAPKSGFEMVFDANGNPVAQKDTATGKIDKLPNSLTDTKSGFEPVFDAFGNTIAQKDTKTGEIKAIPPSMTNTGNKKSENEAKIARLVAQGVDQKSAEGIVDGRIVVSRDPVTNAVVVVDKSTGLPVDFTPPVDQGVTPPADQGAATVTPPVDPFAQSGSAGGPPSSDPTAQTSAVGAVNTAGNTSVGQQNNDLLAGAPGSFGLGGFLKKEANIAANAVGLPVPSKETQDAQTAIRVTNESIARGISQAYKRQPSASLMKDIKTLLPAPGEIFTGSSEAVSKYKALKKSFETELASLNRGLNIKGGLKPTKKTEITQRIIAVETAKSRVQSILDAFDTTPKQTGVVNGIQWSVQ